MVNGSERAPAHNESPADHEEYDHDHDHVAREPEGKVSQSLR